MSGIPQNRKIGNGLEYAEERKKKKKCQLKT